MITTHKTSRTEWAGLDLFKLNGETLWVHSHDRVSHVATGLLDIGPIAVPVRITINTAKDMMMVAIRLGDTDRSITATGLLQVQERSRLAKIAFDSEDDTFTIQAASYCPGPEALRTVFRLLANDIRNLLSDDRLLPQRLRRKGG